MAATIEYADDTHVFRIQRLTDRAWRRLPHHRSVTEKELLGAGLSAGKGWRHFGWHRAEPHVLVLQKRVRADSDAAESLGGNSPVQSQSEGVKCVGGMLPCTASVGESTCADSVGGMSPCTENGPPSAESLGGKSAVQSESFAMDVKLAAKGLSMKLYPHQIPELVALILGMEQASKALEQLGYNLPTRVKALARAFVLLRLVRGVLGIPWVVQQLAAADSFACLLNPAACKRQKKNERNVRRKGSFQKRAKQCPQWKPQHVFQHVGRMLLAAHKKEKHQPKTWAAHREQRHTGLSGSHPLRALTTPAGARGASEASSVHGFVNVLRFLTSHADRKACAESAEKHV